MPASCLPWLLALCISGVSSQQSTLKVAACNPGSVPYVNTDSSGNLVGYDIGEM